jgi:hypothetical protein
MLIFRTTEPHLLQGWRLPWLCRLERISDGDWAPEVNKCHHNVAAWIERNPTHFHVVGWLVLVRPNDDVIRFMTHSIVEDDVGNQFDITPLQSPRRPPFLEAGVHPDDYFEIERQLFAAYDYGGFDHMV